MAATLVGFGPRRVLAWALAATTALALQAASIEAATSYVTNPNDSGAASLRQAILSANATTGQDSIQFRDSYDDGAQIEMFGAMVDDDEWWVGDELPGAGSGCGGALPRARCATWPTLRTAATPTTWIQP